MAHWRIINQLQMLSPELWETLDYADNPFLSYPFLAGLEQHNCLSNQGWQPHHIVIEEGDTLLGVLPLYIKQDSYGEFVFDWDWADAYHHVGRNYYPKLVSAVPFTPVSGTRMLVNKSAARSTIQHQLLRAALTVMNAEQFSSLHILFPDADTMAVLKNQAGLRRISCQYHWFNQHYRDFKDFTDSLRAKKRKKILAERQRVYAMGIEIERLNGHQISAQQWHDFYQFYCTTFYQKWGRPRLTLDFFKAIGQALPEQTLLILAKKAKKNIAGAFAMQDQDTLYGRHWGCCQQVPFLHFELCYYQTIEHAISHGLKKLDAGVQGEHKLARGFEPVAAASAHWLREKDFSDAVATYLTKETVAIQQQLTMLKSHLPYKAIN